MINGLVRLAIVVASIITKQFDKLELNYRTVVSQAHETKELQKAKVQLLLVKMNKKAKAKKKK